MRNLIKMMLAVYMLPTPLHTATYMFHTTVKMPL